MTDALPAIEIPQSVGLYLTDPAVRTATNDLVKISNAQLPEGLQLKEIHDYLTARSAAEMIKYDYVAFMYKLWEQIWGHHLDASWITKPMKALIRDEYEVTLDDCWSTEYLSIAHRKGAFTLATGVSIQEKITAIGYYLEAGGKDIFPITSKSGWRDDPDWGDAWHVFNVPHNIASPKFDLSILLKAADEVMAKVAEIVDAQPA